MKHTLRWLLAAMVTLLAVNCALPKAEVDETPAAFAYSVDNVCPLLVPKLCAARQACCNLTGTGYNQAVCETREMAACQAGVVAYYAGQADFRGTDLDACLAQTTSYFQACGPFSLDDQLIDQGCLWVPFQGKRAEGAPCELAFECAPPPEPRTLVRCENHACVYYRYIPEGGACNAGAGATRICDTGLYCDVDTSVGNTPWNGTCVKAGPPGTNCESSYYCGLGSYCDANGQSCQLLKGPNQPCALGDECQSKVCYGGKCTTFLASEGVCANCLPGQMTDAVGDCDPVGQNCGVGSTCTLVNTGIIACADSPGAGTLFSPCGGHADCAGGFDCYNGRCTRPCCLGLEYDLCGPLGRCNLKVPNDTLGTFIMECTYKPPCNLWSGSAGCVAPETQCGLSGNVTKPACSTHSGNVTSPTIGKACTYTNDCDDSQFCDGTTCRWLCKVQDLGAPPSGTVGGAPGQGGCPTGETCERFPDSTWLGYCSASAT